MEKHSVLRKIGHLACALIYLSIIAFAIAVALSSIGVVEYGTTSPIDRWYVNVVSGSMEPTIKTNSICLVEKVAISEVEVGDIIVYRRPYDNASIIHRVIEKRTTESGQEAVVTKGDNNSTPDDIEVTGDMLRARVIKIYNWTGAIKQKLFGGNVDLEYKSYDIIAKTLGVVTIATIVLVVAVQIRDYVQRKRDDDTEDGGELQ